jgi:hypothetical protein
MSRDVMSLKGPGIIIRLLLNPGRKQGIILLNAKDNNPSRSHRRKGNSQASQVSHASLKVVEMAAATVSSSAEEITITTAVVVEDDLEDKNEIVLYENQ